MAQVSRRPVTTEAGARSRANRVEFLVDKVTLGQFLLLVLRFYPVNIIPPWLSMLIYDLGNEQ
jgi:hypothetical protein